MTIVVCVKVDEGVVLAADSATSLVNGGSVINVYNSGNKVFNLVKGCPIGAMTYGAGSIGRASISNLSKDFRDLLGTPGSPYHLDRQRYSLEDVAKRAREFFFCEKYQTAYSGGNPDFAMGYRICGFSRPGDHPEAWDLLIHNDQCAEPTKLYGPEDYGPRWQGETEALDRLVLGLGSRFSDALVQLGVEPSAVGDIKQEVQQLLYAPLYHPAMPIQDAIDLAKFLAGTAARFAEFSLGPPTVGGRIEVACITKHEGFKWVARKHYFSRDLNEEAFAHE